jgi:hypothetical protein
MAMDKVPLLPSWRWWYFIVVVFLALQVVLYYILGRLFQH